MTVFGNGTRTQFKRESYEIVKTQIECDCACDGDSSTSKRGIVDFSCVDRLVGKLSCPQCKHETLCFRTDRGKPCGLAVHGYIYCTTCEQAVERTEGFLAERGKGELKDYNINRQAVFSALVCGMGATAFNNFSEMMDLRGMHHKTFHKKADMLYDKLGDFESHLFGQTAEYVRQVHARQLGVTLVSTDVLDISVSFDGTWLTRGHSSHIGVGCVVDLLTGLCLDAHVMCTYCHYVKPPARRSTRTNHLSMLAGQFSTFPSLKRILLVSYVFFLI